MGISIGRKDYWGRGHGTDAMRVLLRLAFERMNLHRVYLRVFDFTEPDDGGSSPPACATWRPWFSGRTRRCHRRDESSILSCRTNPRFV